MCGTPAQTPQGAEKEVVILATTVSRAADFASDAKRLNVALTRGGCDIQRRRMQAMPFMFRSWPLPTSWVHLADV